MSIFFGGTFLSLSFQFVYWFTVSKWNQENEKYTIFRVKINKCWFDFYHIAFAYPSNVFWYFRRTNQTMNAWKVSMRIRMKCLRRFPHLSFEPVHCKEHYSCARSMFLFFSGLMLHMGRECVFVCQQMACAVKHSSKLHTSYELSTEGSCIQMKIYCQSSTTTIWNRRLCARSECTEHLLLMAFHKHKLFDSFQRLTFN